MWNISHMVCYTDISSVSLARPEEQSVAFCFACFSCVGFWVTICAVLRVVCINVFCKCDVNFYFCVFKYHSASQTIKQTRYSVRYICIGLLSSGPSAVFLNWLHYWRYSSLNFPSFSWFGRLILIALQLTGPKPL